MSASKVLPLTHCVLAPLTEGIAYESRRIVNEKQHCIKSFESSVKALINSYLGHITHVDLSFFPDSVLVLLLAVLLALAREGRLVDQHARRQHSLLSSIECDLCESNQAQSASGNDQARLDKVRTHVAVFLQTSGGTE